jgi:peptide/nickel transport system substrate-binding protein
MDRRRFLVASASGVGALVVASCSGGSGGGAGGGGTRTVRLSWGSLGFPSPFACFGDLGYNQMSLMYDTLLWKDGSGKLLPWLAKSYDSSPDHLTYTFQLRDNLKWSDGQPLTSDDVVFTFEYYAKQKVLFPPVIIQPPQGIAKVVATGPQTVQIVLEVPTVTFLEQIAGAVPIVPRHVWSSVSDPGAAQDTKLLIGSGAYRLTKYSGDGDPMQFVARDDFFLGPPYIKRVDELAIEDPFPALLTGQVDSAFGEGLRPDVLAPFEANKAFGKITAPGSSASVLYWNLKKGGAMADPRFREACAMAIDRQEFVTRLASGHGMPGNPGFLSPRNPFYSPVRQYPVDVAGANALLDSAGYRAAGGSGIRRDPNGNPLSFQLLYNNAEPGLSEILIGNLRRIGVEITTKPVEMGPQLFGSKAAGNYDVSVLRFPGPGPGGPNADPDILRQLFSSNVAPLLLSATGYSNPEFNDLAARQLVAFDEGERKALVAKMQGILANDVPVLTLYYPETVVLFRRAVLDQWYFTPGEFPSLTDNKQLFITGQKNGTTIRSQ